MPLVCLHWHQCWYTHDLSMSGNQLSVGNYMVVSYNRYATYLILKTKLHPQLYSGTVCTFINPILLHFPVKFLINFYWIFQTGFLFSRFINVMCQVSIFWHCWFTRRRFLNIKIINHFRPPLGTPDIPNITLEEDHPRNIWAKFG